MCLLAGMCARARVCVCVCVLVCPCETCLYTCNFVCAGGCMPISLFVCLLVCFRAFAWMRVYNLACPMRRACIPVSLFMCPPAPGGHINRLTGIQARLMGQARLYTRIQANARKQTSRHTNRLMGIQPPAQTKLQVYKHVSQGQTSTHTHTHTRARAHMPASRHIKTNK